MTTGRRRARRRGETVRAQQWWHHKLPPIVAVGALAVGARPGPPDGGALVELALLLTSAVGVAAFGHLVNDWADIDADARGGKTNVLAARPVAARAGYTAAALAVGVAPWFGLPARAPAVAALVTEVVLLLAYSLPPTRLKARGWVGAAADATYAYALPFVLALTVLGPAGAPRAGLVVGATAAWGLLMGLRGILDHQLEDVDADRAAGVETAAARWGEPRARVALSVLVPLEVVALAVAVAAADVGWLPWVLLGFVGWRAFQMFLLWDPPLELRRLRERDEVVRLVGFELGNQLVERWLPPAALVALALDGRVWWVAVVVHLVLFRTFVRDIVAHDVWMVPDALERLAFSRGVRADIRAVAAERQARVAAGPAPPPGCDGRWVFVVCGPLSHLLTLRTAVRHLRPVTEAEIWVLTDASRNEAVIDIEGVDHVVDVRTPEDLDDHQASIWLKTSVHRHVPEGEWCYLDSDIIAAGPGVEGVFAHRRGPVAFASDVTIRENSVDRFSPWAMTCPCRGYADEHSCGHLREQLRERFDLEVPGDWLHWNGGVFLFGPDSGPFLDMWHDRAVASFAWPEWKTRDQGALIATVWSQGLQDLHRIPATFNFIADLGNHDLCLDRERGWAHHPSGPWYDALLLHLYTSPLEDPLWDLGRDVEAVVLRRSRVRLYRFHRSELKYKVRQQVIDSATDVRWSAQLRAETWAMRVRRFPRRLRPARLVRALRVRLGLPVPPFPEAPDDVEPQRSSMP